jgi:inorganic pyrophosphatase
MRRTCRLLTKKGQSAGGIETPKGSRNKYAFDEKQKIFALKKVLPAGIF